jgi:hypothetical protein
MGDRLRNNGPRRRREQRRDTDVLTDPYSAATRLRCRHPQRIRT